MSDWIHCNKCFKQPTSNDDKFNLTNCGHFICATCASEKPGFCYECESNCSTMILTPNLSDDIRCYFENVDMQFEQIKRCMKTMEFQKNHRQKFFAHIFEENVRSTKEVKENLFKYNAAKEYIKRLTLKNEELQKENKSLKDIIKNKMRDLRPSPSVQNYGNGMRGQKPFPFNLQTPTKVSTPRSRNHSFFSDKNLLNRTGFSNTSSTHSSYFVGTPSPAINLPFQTLFLNSNKRN